MATFFAVNLMLAGLIILPTESKAATYTYEDEIIYTDDVKNAVALYNKKEAPTKAGYVFGGWFADDEGKKQIATDTVEANETLFAKFVPAYVLSVKAQNHKDVSNTSSTGTFRLVSSVDSNANYQEVGFDVLYGNIDQEGYRQTAKGSKVYSKIIVHENNGTNSEYVPEDVFGQHAKYFNIAVVKGIKSTSFSKTIYVKPYWITNDGTKVYGLGKYVCIQDGLDGIISIPINLYTAQAIAAGIVELTYPKELTYYETDGYRQGDRLLNEMKVNVDKKTRTIRCAGNAASNVQADTDIYISLRFKIADEYKNTVTIGKTRLNFEIKDTQFCDWSEQFVTMTDYVWDVQY